MAKPVRIIALVAVLLAVLAGGTVAAVWWWKGRVDRSIGQADLLGPSQDASPSPSPSPSPPPGADITGPLTILIVGIDTRESQPSWPHHADAVMILHVSKDLSQAYLTSLPRDLVVDIPAFKPSGYGGGRSKLTHAMTFGASKPGSGRFDPAQGFQLLAATVRKYTGIKRFDAGAVITFSGYQRLIDALGGVDIYIDQKVASIHRRPDGTHRTPCAGCANGYSGPRMVYRVGNAHLSGWQALDYARQRYIEGGEYSRQRHQRQLIKAMLAKLMQLDLPADLGRVDEIVAALGKTLIFDGRGRKPTEFAYALRGLRPPSMHLIGLPGRGAYSGRQYLGERLDPEQAGYFAALRNDTLAAWTRSHPKLVDQTSLP